MCPLGHGYEPAVRLRGDSAAARGFARYESGMRISGVNLTAREAELIDQTTPAAMARLDAEELMDLHARVRRARNKYMDLYRRRGAAKVSAKGARGVAAEANERGWAKAEVFEEALARVSRQLAVVTQKHARELKQERLAAARGTGSAPASSRAAAKPAGTARAKAGQPRKTAGRVKFEASTKATGARRQAKRDSR